VAFLTLTYTQPFYCWSGICPGPPGSAGTRKVKPIRSLTITKTYRWCTTTLHPFNSLFPRTTWVRRHQKGKPFWILMKQKMMGGSGISWTILQIICTLLQIYSYNHASTSPLSFYRPDTLPAAQSTASKH